MIVVRSLNEPAEINRQSYLMKKDADEEAAGKGLTPASLLSCDPAYPEGKEVEQLYGDKYNTSFLNSLAQIEKDRESLQKINAKNPLFTWLELPKEIEADNAKFNSEIEGAKPVYSIIKKRSEYKLDPTGIVPNDLEINKVYSKSLDAKPIIIKRSL